MDLEHGGHLRARAIVGRDVERFDQTAGREWVGDITDHRAAAWTVSVSEDVRLRRYNNQLAANYRAIAVYHDWITCGSRGRDQAYWDDKTD